MVFGLFVVLVLAGTVINETPEGKERMRKRLLSEQCWSNYESKSLDPATKRFVAGVCEKIDAAR